MVGILKQRFRYTGLLKAGLPKVIRMVINFMHALLKSYVYVYNTDHCFKCVSNCVAFFFFDTSVRNVQYVVNSPAMHYQAHKLLEGCKKLGLEGFMFPYGVPVTCVLMTKVKHDVNKNLEALLTAAIL